MKQRMRGLPFLPSDLSVCPESCLSSCQYMSCLLLAVKVQLSQLVHDRFDRLVVFLSLLHIAANVVEAEAPLLPVAVMVTVTITLPVRVVVSSVTVSPVAVIPVTGGPSVPSVRRRAIVPTAATFATVSSRIIIIISVVVSSPPSVSAIRPVSSVVVPVIGIMSSSCCTSVVVIVIVVVPSPLRLSVRVAATEGGRVVVSVSVSVPGLISIISFPP